jgi:4-hydroxy-3-methylbut-2-enyl diphosphate reductase
MQVTKITPRGYCHGVVEAIRMAKQVASDPTRAGQPVTMLGYLVHNQHVTDELQASGVALVDTGNRLDGLQEITEGTVIFTAHGVSPEVVAAATSKGLAVVNATCSDVTRTHNLVRDLLKQQYRVVYIGRRGHPEPEGVVGIDPEHITLIENKDEIASLAFAEDEKLAVTCQTTLSIWDTKEIIDALAARYPNIEIHNEICLATQERQEAAVLAADDCDCVVVVGSQRSSNSLRLVQVVKERAHKPAYLVDTAADLRPDWFVGVAKVGVTSGASTPTQLTREVIAALEAM